MYFVSTQVFFVMYFVSTQFQKSVFVCLCESKMYFVSTQLVLGMYFVSTQNVLKMYFVSTQNAICRFFTLQKCNLSVLSSCLECILSVLSSFSGCILSVLNSFLGEFKPNQRENAPRKSALDNLETQDTTQNTPEHLCPKPGVTQRARRHIAREGALGRN